MSNDPVGNRRSETLCRDVWPPDLLTLDVERDRRGHDRTRPEQLQVPGLQDRHHVELARRECDRIRDCRRTERERIDGFVQRRSRINSHVRQHAGRQGRADACLQHLVLTPDRPARCATAPAYLGAAVGLTAFNNRPAHLVGMVMAVRGVNLEPRVDRVLPHLVVDAGPLPLLLAQRLQD
jgi:hypothetical protein